MTTSYAPDPTADAATLHRALLVMVISMVAGLLVAGALLPVVGTLGFLARTSADSFNKLPSDLVEPRLPQRSRILAADGSLLADIYLNENRIVVPIDEIPPTMQQAIIAIEDERFYEHGGIDWKAVARAVVRNQQAGEVRQGGSTLTQQYVKNVLIESAGTQSGVAKARERSTGRKLREARYAIALERKLGKREILEKYLNIAYFGNGVYGVGTASAHYFGHAVQRLTLDEAALLAGMVKNPRVYDPQRDVPAAQDRRNVVLDAMLRNGFITARQADRARHFPVKRRLHLTTPMAPDTSIAPFFLDYLLRELPDNPSYQKFFGDTREERTARIFQGGLTIRTTLDPALQRAAQAAVDGTLDRTGRVAAAVVVVKPGTGEIKAMAVNRAFGSGRGKTKVNLATGGIRGYQAGSTFKVFVLASAIQQGIPLRLRLAAPPVYASRIFKLSNGRPYVVRNAEPGEGGVYDVERATWESVNTFYIQLEERTGASKPAALARAMGVTTFPVHAFGSFTLGTNEVSPLDMAVANATFAARGLRCEATGLASVADSAGKPLPPAVPDCERVMEPRVADAVSQVLRGVIDGPDPYRTGLRASIGRPAAGKTGTTQNFGAAWFNGYTPDFASAVWVGDPRGPKYKLLNVQGVRRVYGGTFPALIWQQVMSAAHEGLPVSQFTAPDAGAYSGIRTGVPDVRGLKPEDATKVLATAGFAANISALRVAAGPIREGLVGGQSPAPGAAATPGATVTLYLSNGLLPPVPPSPTGSATASATAPPASRSPTPARSPTPRPKPTKSPKPRPSRSPSPQPSPTPTPSGAG
ncbi:MAG: transglycosylase domain-containing protein [Mycobacteriales bacterium]|nr:transglycosylase domain-containing protein [Frankia sp.]